MKSEFVMAAALLREMADAIESADEGDGEATIDPRSDNSGYVMTVRGLRTDEGFSLTAHGWNRTAVTDLKLRVQTD